MGINERFNWSQQTGEPEWVNRSHRSLDAVAVPRLSAIAPDLLDGLRPLTTLMIARPIVAAIVFFLSATRGWWLIALPATWLVYGGTLTAVHHLIHSSMGLSPRARRFWLSALGMLVAESGHALQTTHLMHHRAGHDLPDPEGYIENVSWLGLPLAALRFRYRLAFWGLRHSPRPRRIAAEMAVHAAVHIASLILLPFFAELWWFLTLIHLASFGFAALAGKGPQTNWGREVETPYVRVISRFGRILLFSHDRHLEHHLYPKVPMPRLRHLEADLEPVFANLTTVNVRMPV